MATHCKQWKWKFGLAWDWGDGERSAGSERSDGRVKAPWGEEGREAGKKGSNLCPPDGRPAVGLSCQRSQRWGPASSALAPPAACGCPSWRSDPPPPSRCPPEGHNTTIISLVQHPPPPSYCPPDGHNNHQSCTTPPSTLPLPSWWTQYIH